MSGEGRVRCETRDGVAHILFDNQRAYNALTNAMWHELADHCSRIAGDPDIRAVTCRGAGEKSFISGNDISGFLDFETGADGIAYEREVGACVEAVEQLPQPTIALVNGWAVGGGLAIAFACDFRIATSGSRFGSPIARTIGNCLSAKGYARILWHVGPALAKRM
ncbi:MAG: enoyl-CoA hydratase/isomerase family protein, partial [Sphingomonadales bacterium]|nr:enoyl-CoA hydratase/isomerase family protein [Sphingomonadales bacterium]